MEATEIIDLVRAPGVVAKITIGNESTGWRWKYFFENDQWFAAREFNGMILDVDSFDSVEEATEHAEGWTVAAERAEARALGLDDDEDDDEPEFVYDDVEA